jgi:hypothetical protein
MEAEIVKKNYIVLHKISLRYEKVEAKLTSFVEGVCKLQMGEIYSRKVDCRDNIKKVKENVFSLCAPRRDMWNRVKLQSNF